MCQEQPDQEPFLPAGALKQRGNPSGIERRGAARHGQQL